MVLGLFRNMRESRRARSLEKCGNVLKNKVTTKEQRMEAMDSLFAEEDPDLAIPQIMKRFEIVIESGIQDKREKELCAEHILEFGEKAGSFIEKALQQSVRISWTLHMAEKHFDAEKYLQLLLGVLEEEMPAFDDAATERHGEVILALKELRDERIVEPVAAYLAERDETLRMAALECMEAQAAHSDSAKQVILKLLEADESDDNSRFLGIVRTMVAKNSWSEPTVGQSSGSSPSSPAP